MRNPLAGIGRRRLPRDRTSRPVRFRPSARPSGYIYTTGYVFVITGPAMLGLGIVRLDWRWLTFGLGLVTFATLFYAFLGWCRERFDALNPDDVDHETLRIDKALDTISLRAIRIFAKILSRHRR